MVRVGGAILHAREAGDARDTGRLVVTMEGGGRGVVRQGNVQVGVV